ncbi:MAG: FtsX-like permease family protein [bacterium]|nr:FtsX-like permease family protein [bacterium]
MFKNYIKIALRNIRRNKVLSSINILGMSLGIACCLLIFLIIQDDRSFDKFNENFDNIYITKTERFTEGRSYSYPYTPAPLAEAMVEEIPDIINTARLNRRGRSVVRYNDKMYYEDGICHADPSILEIFTLPLLSGNPASALSQPHSAIIDEKSAEKYFGDDDPVGETVFIENLGDYIISGVMKNIPLESSIQFNILLPIDRIAKNDLSKWKNSNYQTYLLLLENSSYIELNNFLDDWETENADESYSYSVTHISHVMLYDNDLIIFHIVFSSFAVIVLLIGCFNFMNLTTAHASSRALEIGVRKVIGASRKNIVKQCIGESVITAFIALLIALVLAKIALPHLNNMSNKRMSLDLINNLPLLSACLGITIITGIFSGSYPAFVLSSYQPVKVLKGGLFAGSRRLVLRRVLIVLQFTFSVVFMIGAFIFQKQTDYMLNMDVGFEKEDMIMFRIKGEIGKRYGSFTNELLQRPEIVSITAGSTYPSGPQSSLRGESSTVTWEGKDPDTNFNMYYLSVDQTFINSFGISVLRGRDFSSEFSSDTTNYILNETAVRAIGLEDPLGKEFSLFGRTGRIIGVVKDFHFDYLHIEIRPLILRMVPLTKLNYSFIRLSTSQDITEIISLIENTWKNYEPNFPFEYFYLDDVMDRETRDAGKTILILTFVAFFIILLSCLGLFALALFITEQKTKEIAVRKVLGAAVPKIVLSLSRDFMKWVLLSNIFAWPIAWVIMDTLLQSFPYKTDVGWSNYIISSLIVLTIASLTISYKVFRAASGDPVDSLRYE